MMRGSQSIGPGIGNETDIIGIVVTEIVRKIVTGRGTKRDAETETTGGATDSGTGGERRIVIGTETGTKIVDVTIGTGGTERKPAKRHGLPVAAGGGRSAHRRLGPPERGLFRLMIRTGRRQNGPELRAG